MLRRQTDGHTPSEREARGSDPIVVVDGRDTGLVVTGDTAN
jgi:hypothetical protein